MRMAPKDKLSQLIELRTFVSSPSTSKMNKSTYVRPPAYIAMMSLSEAHSTLVHPSGTPSGPMGLTCMPAPGLLEDSKIISIRSLVIHIGTKVQLLYLRILSWYLP